MTLTAKLNEMFQNRKAHPIFKVNGEIALGRTIREAQNIIFDREGDFDWTSYQTDDDFVWSLNPFCVAEYLVVYGTCATGSPKWLAERSIYLAQIAAREGERDLALSETNKKLHQEYQKLLGLYGTPEKAYEKQRTFHQKRRKELGLYRKL